MMPHSFIYDFFSTLAAVSIFIGQIARDEYEFEKFEFE